MDTNDDSLAERRGQHWWDLRRKLQQVMLNPASGANFLYVQDRVVEDFLDHLEAVKDKDGYVENIQTELFSLSLEVLGEICYGTRLNSFQNGIPEVRSALKTTFDCLNESLRGIPTFLLFRTPMYQRFEDATKTLQTFYTQNFESCLQRSKESSEFKNIIPNLLLNHKNISLKELCSTISSLFTAGTESTTNTLSFALYHLASHPEKQEKLWHEINRFVPEFPTAKQSELVKPPYLTACVKESFRMVYPTLAGPHRILDRDINISGYCIPKGVHVVCQNALMCRMEEYFENADDYVPERWLRRHNPPSAKFSHGETVDMRPFVVLPFGHGLRSCIGRRFAEQQIYLVIAKMLQRYKLVYDGEEILVKEKIFTAPDRPIRLKLVPR
ncbi:cytochrome P450 3A19-like [Lingula anatina]|uniref:Cytochrome P450 3A19-like n=1 Tax=Lingula anatina TaxID=7574 RepID=A0A1S3JIL6_LINAN|nr:cytochrome P450 3A19-like [Lingula anatina]|eukprot:XP_013409744.1 cytochrome P450 3A19-like [Lingula anatina]